MSTPFVVMTFCKKDNTSVSYSGHALTMPKVGEKFTLYVRSVKEPDSFLLLETSPVESVNRHTDPKTGDMLLVFKTLNSIYEMRVKAYA